MGKALEHANLNPVFGQCRLAKNGSNITLSPFNGNLLTVNGVACTIPSAGVSLAPTGLTVSTLYSIYAVATAGVITSLEASTTLHTTSSTAGNVGVEIKTGDDTRSFVGLIVPATGPAFIDTPAVRYVRSWYNRKVASMQGAALGTNTVIPSSTAEINSVLRLNAITFADESVSVNLNASYFGSNVGAINLGASYDGTSDTITTINPDTSGKVTMMPVSYVKDGLTEGAHYITISGLSTSSGANLYAATFLTGRIG